LRCSFVEMTNSFFLFLWICLSLSSRQDEKWYRGLKEPSPGQPPPEEEEHQRYYFLHTPKTAGSSFLKDAPEHMPTSTSLRGSEDCTKSRERSMTMLMLRSPVDHVISQFMECRYDPALSSIRTHSFPVSESVTDDFKDWLFHFDEDWNDAAGDFNCYNPYNMQARYIICPRRPHAHHSRAHTLFPKLDIVPMLESFFFFGVSEYYSESICLLYYRFFKTLPRYCNCATKKAGFPQHKILHNIPRYRPSMSPDILRQISRLVEIDEALYEKGLELFFSQIHELENETGINIVCPAPSQHSENPVKFKLTRSKPKTRMHFNHSLRKPGNKPSPAVTPKTPNPLDILVQMLAQRNHEPKQREPPPRRSTRTREKRSKFSPPKKEATKGFWERIAQFFGFS